MAIPHTVVEPSLRPPRGWTLNPRAAAVAAAAALCLLASALAPVPLLAALIVLGGAAFLIYAAPFLRTPYLAGFSLLLAGYAYFGRLFAYVRYPPIFIGECFLVAGLLIALGSGSWSRLTASPLTWAVVLFAVWGAVTTLPFVGTHGLDALRDAVVWGYALFAAIVALSMRVSHVAGAVRAYRLVSLCLPFAVVLTFVTARALGEDAPGLPWAPEVSLATMKLGDAGVHLAGAAAFGLLGFVPKVQRGVMPVVWWTCWFAAMGIVAAQSRGGLLAVVVSLLVVAAAGGAKARWTLVRVCAAGAVIAMLALTFPAQPVDDAIDSQGGRQVTPRQLAANVISIFGSIGYGESGGGFVNLDETRVWRLQWWSDIVSYTVGGQYFWRGKGYGINLADDDGYQVNPELPLRSPHNIHLTILARSGVPGLLLWLGLNAMLVAALVRGRRDARADGQDQWARLYVWVLAYWAAIVVNATFDVYVEGPAGGIWFWSLIGFAIAVLSLRPRPGSAIARQASASPGVVR